MVGFSKKEVRFHSGALRLAGVVMLPEGSGASVPGVVFVHGSGNSDRRNPWYQEIAEYLANKGIAVLLPDKRGCHESEGDWKWADFRELAEDSIAGVRALRAQEGIDPKRIGFIGISQGGWIAPLAACLGNIAFIVSLSGATVTPIEQFRYEHMQDVLQKGLPSAFCRISFPLDELFLRWRWPIWPKVKNFDPITLWETLPVPALLVFGGEDENVPIQESLRRLEAVIHRTRRQDLSVNVFLGSGHALRDPRTKRIRRDVLCLLSEWIKSR